MSAHKNHQVENGIEHNGVVTGIGDNTIDVSMETLNACAACKVRGVCGAGSEGDKSVHVFVANASAFSVGEQVVISVSSAMGMKAVVIAYLVPLVLMLAFLGIMLGNGAGEAAAGLGSLGLAALYYVVLRFFRNKIERGVVFKVRKIR